MEKTKYSDTHANLKMLQNLSVKRKLRMSEISL
jgi:hypothetical protein